MTLAKVLLAIAVTAASGVGSYVVVRVEQPPAPTSIQCDLARLDAAWVLDMMLSPKCGDREAARGVYYRALLEQRRCALFAAPTLRCDDDGCRAAALAIGQITIPR